LVPRCSSRSVDRVDRYLGDRYEAAAGDADSLALIAVLGLQRIGA
jgi:hypothetical protein